MKRSHIYILLAIVLVSAWLFMPDNVSGGKTRWQKWFGPKPTQPPTEPVQELRRSTSAARTSQGIVPMSDRACPVGWVWNGNQCVYRYQFPWKWPDAVKPRPI